MPIPVIWIAAVGAAALVGAAGWLEADSQHDARVDERKRFRAELDALESRLANAEDRHRRMRRRLGARNRRQVKTLAGEVARLRRERDAARRRLDE